MASHMLRSPMVRMAKRREWRVGRSRAESEAFKERVREMYLGGMKQSEIAAETGVSRARVQQIVKGMPTPSPFVEPSSEAVRSIRVSLVGWEGARAVAKELGLVNDRGKDVGKGTVNQLIEAIGRGKLIVTKAPPKR